MAVDARRNPLRRANASRSRSKVSSRRQARPIPQATAPDEAAGTGLAATHTEQSRERGALSSVDLGELDLLQQLLLVTDGTVTHFLAASMGEEIEAALLEQRIRVVDEEQQVLELWAEQGVLERRVLLRGVVSGRTYLHGASVIALDRVPGAVRDGLLHGDAPIGSLLRQHRVETFREILWSGGTVAGDLAPHFLVPEGTPMLVRRYLIWIERRPALLITETFPRSWCRDPSPPGPVARN